jgi:hypothetical protein
VDLFLLAVNDGGAGGGRTDLPFTGLRGQCPLGADGMSHYQPLAPRLQPKFLPNGYH